VLVSLIEEKLGSGACVNWNKKADHLPRSLLGYAVHSLALVADSFHMVRQA
jgi:hypothetical protein